MPTSPERLEISEAFITLKETIKLRACSFAGIHIPESIPGDGKVYGYHHLQGIEVGDLIDPEHPVTPTRFETIVLFPGAASMRFREAPVRLATQEYPGDDLWLRRISEIANDPRSYDLKAGIADRREYLRYCVAAMRHLYHSLPEALLQDAVIVPVERAGGNIARALKLVDEANTLGLEMNSEIAIEGKRLRFKNLPNLLGAGINLPPGIEQVKGKPVRLLEAVLASGSTVTAARFALTFRGLDVPAVYCDSVVACPIGASYLAAFREIWGDYGTDNAVGFGGWMNPDWYLEFYGRDPLLRIFPEAIRAEMIGKQVVGDSGDLTSNLSL